MITRRGAMSIPAGLYFGRNKKRPQREYPAPALKPFYTQRTNSKKCAGFSNGSGLNAVLADCDKFQFSTNVYSAKIEFKPLLLGEANSNFFNNFLSGGRKKV